METTELTRMLQEATARLEPRPGFTAAVVRGGRRRRTRNRVVLATAVVSVAAVAGTSTYVLWPDPVPATQVADPRLTQPTRGDLAGDRKFLDRTLVAWRNGLSRWETVNLRGLPHVYWAGTTPAGSAAVIMQQYLQSTGDLAPGDHDRMSVLIGLVATDPVDGKLKVVYEDWEPYPDPIVGRGHFQFGPGDRTILVVDRGTPLWISAKPIISRNGMAARDWQPLPVTEGVAITQLPDDVRASDARVLVRREQPARDDKNPAGMLMFERSSYYLDVMRRGWEKTHPAHPRTEPRLRWNDTAALQLLAGDTSWPIPGEHGWLTNVFLDALQDWGVTDTGSRSFGPGPWTVIAGLPDGRVAIVREYLEDEKPSRLFAVLLNRDGTLNTVVDGDRTPDSGAALPVAVKLPDRQGWVVARYPSQLSYRTTPDGPWQDAGQNAALLPDNAVHVRVTEPGGATRLAELVH